MQSPVQKPGAQKGQTAGLLLIRICVGVYLCALGFSRISWLMDATPLTSTLSAWIPESPTASRWYLERVLPGAPIFARVLPLASMAGGLALVLGFWTRLAAGLSFLLLLNVQLASALLFRTTYLVNPHGLLLAGALLGIAIGGGRLPLSLRK
jgi:uncharacterized membrane protein YphA (DoxX/SURF4 family)